MKTSITPNQIKQNNLQLIYQFIYNHEMVSQQDIAYKLHLSRPTVTSKLTELENEGLIKKGGPISSDQVGRKAAGYSIVADYRISIGVDIHQHEVKLICVNLLGEYSHRIVHNIEYANSMLYIDQVCDLVLEYIEMLSVKPEQILGIGIAMPGVVSPDGSVMTYGKILDCTGVRIDRYAERLPYPCRFFHDAESAATSELWASPDFKNGVYLSLSPHLGSAAITDRKIIAGKHGQGSTIEHITMIPNGKMCYCGKRGCAETLCSVESLLIPSEDVEDFFDMLRKGDSEAGRRWDEFLGNLAALINTANRVYDTNFILGGFLAPYIIEEDLEKLYDLINQLTPFVPHRDFLSISKMPKHNITIGAALPYIQAFLDRH